MKSLLHRILWRLSKKYRSRCRARRVLLEYVSRGVTPDEAEIILDVVQGPVYGLPLS